LARAEAGGRNHEAPDRFADAYCGLPTLQGAAADTTVRDITAGPALCKPDHSSTPSEPWRLVAGLVSG
jgi:hypothetical protein